MVFSVTAFSSPLTAGTVSADKIFRVNVPLVIVCLVILKLYILYRRTNADGHESPAFSSSDNNDDDDDGNSEENTSERSHREGGNQLFSSLSSENLQQELNKCTSDGLSDKENVVRRMRHQVKHIPGRLQVGVVFGGGRGLVGVGG